MEEILLNPNIAYIFLVGGFSMALMAILTPGTGILEIGALFSLLLSGWAVYNLPLNYWALLILMLSVIPFIIAVRKKGQIVQLAISILALVIGSAFLFQGDAWWKPAVNPILALVVSLLTGGFFWFAARKIIEAKTLSPSHGMEGLIGSLGEAKSAIHHEGSVQVFGELWTARSETPIEEGAIVSVTNREGFILDVVLVEE